MPTSTPPALPQLLDASPCAELDSGLTESIQNLTVEELVQLKAEAEASGMADHLRAMVNGADIAGLRERREEP